MSGPFLNYREDYAYVLERLRDARKTADLTQADVSALTGRGQSWVSKIERGEIEVAFLELVFLARIYGRPITDFVPPPRS